MSLMQRTNITPSNYEKNAQKQSLNGLMGNLNFL